MICKQTPGGRPPGFTLLEVMIAVAIMSMALVAAIGSQSQSVSLATEAKFSTTATLLAQSKMADLEAKEPTELFSDARDFGEDFPGYRWESEVSDATLEEFPEASRHLKKIVLTVGQSENDKYRYRLEYYRFVPEKD